MVDEAPRPAWNVPTPPTPPAPAPEPAAPEPVAQEPVAQEPAPSRPSWEPAPAAPTGPPQGPATAEDVPAARRPEQRLVIPVLIGLVSVTGAVVTWQSALAGEKATDRDRQAVAETVQVSQAAADVEIVVQDAIVRFSEHAASLISAELLESDAERFRSIGNDAAAELAADEAVAERAVARRVLEGGAVGLAEYVDDSAEDPFFDSSQLRTDLVESVARDLQVDPEQTQAEANELREESERLDAWLIALVGAVVLLTFAQISRRRPFRLAFLGAGTAVWVVATVMAFGG